MFVIESGETSATVIKDLVITGGQGSDGGGIYCEGSIDYSNPTISGCTITGNSASDEGGGIWCELAKPTIIGCTITGNSAGSDGGGIFCSYGSSPAISDCTISNNNASSGGGIYCYNSSSPTISGCSISNNTSNSVGGGIYIDLNSNATIASTLFCGNDPDDIAGNYTDAGGNTFQGACPSVCCTNGHCVTAEDGATRSECLKYFGQWFEFGDCNDCSPHLAGDLNGDGDVDANDLDSLHASLGICPHDIDHDGDTDVEDLLRFLDGYGTTCP